MDERKQKHSVRSRTVLSVKLKNRIRNTIIRKTTRVKDTAEYATKEMEMSLTHRPNE